MVTLMLRASFCLLFFCACAVTAPTRAQEPDRASQVRRMDQIASYYADQGSFMGTVLVAEGDKVLLSKGYGYANAEWKIPQQPDVEFHLGSISKQFTAALVLMLQEEGKLQVTAPVSRYLPNVPKAWAAITVENLLNHTSGLRNFVGDPRFDGLSMSPHTVAEQMAFISGYPVDFEPGSKFVYSNTNYFLLSRIVEAVSGTPFREVLQQRIFSKLGMMHTGSESDELLLPHRAQGYKQGKAGLERVREISFAAPSPADGGGALYSNTEDLLRWDRALFGGKVVNKASLAFMTRQGLGNYGAGQFHDKRHGETVIEHGGAIEGFNAGLSYVPSRQLTVIVLCNRERSAEGLVSGQLLDVLLGAPVVLGDEPSPSISLAELERLAGTYVAPSNAPGRPVEIIVTGKTLSMKEGKETSKATYEGAWGGRLRFTVPEFGLEFQLDSEKDAPTMNLHPTSDNALTKRLQQ